MVTSINTTNFVSCVIIMVAHDVLKKITSGEFKSMINDNPIFIDVHGFLMLKRLKTKAFIIKVCSNPDWPPFTNISGELK